jgi:hypothetical protein
MSEEKTNEEIKGIRERIMHPKATSLNIKRAPKDSVDVFKKFANDQFVGDYGMAFKYLVDKLLIEPQPIVQLVEAIEDHEGRIAKLEGKPTENKKVRKMLSGREIGGTEDGK